MQGRKQFEAKLMVYTSLQELVPTGNYYRKLNGALDLQWLYKATAPYYGTEGNPSIDPVVFFKIMIVGYLNNINSDRQLLSFCADSLSIRLFIGYDLDETLPCHSTLSRTRALYGEDIFIKIFQQVLQLCIAKQMVAGKRQCIDSAFVKANASMDSLVEKEVLEDVSTYANELDENSEFKVKKEVKQLVERHHKWKAEAYKKMPGHVVNPKQLDEHGKPIRPKFVSNHTHYSKTDAAARISTKPGKPRQLNYLAQVSVDDKNHVITGALADYANKKDSDCLEQIVNQTQTNLQQNHITIAEVIADAGYSSGKALKYLEQQNITAYIPNFGQYKAERVGFRYNATENQYECQQGNRAILKYKGIKTDSKGYEKKQYRSSESDCKDCPLRANCCGKVTKFKKIEDSIDKPYYDRMHERLTQNASYAKRMIRKRSSTVEPVLGTLINFRNMKRVNTRGIALANKHVLLAAMTYNLQKYLKFITQTRKTAIKAIAISKKH
ncbi:MAG: IS1182 family transposase, partial [Chitinophagales bacterium]